MVELRWEKMTDEQYQIQLYFWGLCYLMIFVSIFIVWYNKFRKWDDFMTDEEVDVLSENETKKGDIIKVNIVLSESE